MTNGASDQEKTKLEMASAKMVVIAKKAKADGKRIKDSTDFQKASD